jgi:hypothetical protein
MCRTRGNLLWSGGGTFTATIHKYINVVRCPAGGGLESQQSWQESEAAQQWGMIVHDDVRRMPAL